MEQRAAIAADAAVASDMYCSKTIVSDSALGHMMFWVGVMLQIQFYLMVSVQ